MADDNEDMMFLETVIKATEVAIANQHKLKPKDRSSKPAVSLESTNSNHVFTRFKPYHMTGKCSCSKQQQEIDSLKQELLRVSNRLTNLEQECSKLKKDREKSEEI